VRQARLVEAASFSGRHPYLTLWGAGAVGWAILVHWLRLPHWAGYFSWAPLTFLMAAYFPLFVGISRVLVHRSRFPVILAAPVVWTGLELLRAYVPDGFTMAGLGHASYRWPALLQVADLAGAYTVTFVIVAVAACVVRMIPLAGNRPVWWPALVLASLLTAALGYGSVRLAAVTAMLTGSTEASEAAGSSHVSGTAASPGAAASPGIAASPGAVSSGDAGGSPGAGAAGVHVAMIQSSFDATFTPQPGRTTSLYQEMRSRTQEALRTRPDVNLVVWPETMLVAFARHEQAQAGKIVGSILLAVETEPEEPGQPKETHGLFERPPPSPRMRHFALAPDVLAEAPSRPALLIGASVRHVHLDAHGRVAKEDDHNSALLLAPGGEVLGRYDKMHAVIFGEYVPLGNLLPWLYRLSPLRDGLCEGERPESFEVHGLRFCPSICYESILPHEVRGSVARLRAEGREPDVLVNQTNSGWFYGSSELDLHLICNVLRAVECRKTVLVAANTGFSAWIDAAGTIRAQAQRYAPDCVYARVGPSRGDSLYLHLGDSPWWACLAVCGWGAAVGLRAKWRERRTSPRRAKSPTP